MYVLSLHWRVVAAGAAMTQMTFWSELTQQFMQICLHYAASADMSVSLLRRTNGTDTRQGDFHVLIQSRDEP